MSKIICDVCGTSYPETSTQCPICGCVRSSDSVTIAGDTSEVAAKTTAPSSYNYVKGGRFSKANVKKRNAGKPLYSTDAPKKSRPEAPAAQSSLAEPELIQPGFDKPKQSGFSSIADSKPEQIKKQPAAKKDVPKKKGKKGEIGLVIAIVALLFAIAGVAIYIACRYLDILPNNPVNDKPGTSQQVPNNDATEPSESKVECTGLKLEKERVQLNSVGATILLNVKAEPEDQDFKLTFKSDDESVATVDANGLVTAKGKGIATITISCGDVSTKCTVTCNIENVEEPTESTDPTEPIPNYTAADLTFVNNGYGYDYSVPLSSGTLKVYNGKIPVELVEFTSSDETVATVVDGVVTLIKQTGYNPVVITAKYNDWVIECDIHIY